MSKILRRSGNAVTQYCDVIGWQPQAIYMVGVGMHHEETTVFRECWPDTELYGWEANPEVYKSVKDAFPGIIHSKAISSYDGTIKVHCRHNWKDGGTVYAGHDRCRTVDVACTTLDRCLCLPKSPRGLLWLDCEGSELAAIVGGRNFIEDRVAMVNVELTGNPRVPDWPTPERIHAELMQLGFLQAWIHSIRPSIAQCDAVYVRRDLFNPAYCCVPDSIIRHRDGS